MRSSLTSTLQRAHICVCTSGIIASAVAVDDVISGCIGKRSNAATGELEPAVKVFIFGFSMGGHMALQMAGQQSLFGGSCGKTLNTRRNFDFQP